MKSPHSTLEELGHQQPPTAIITDNESPSGLLHKSMVPKAFKSMDMQLNWLKCCHAYTHLTSNEKWVQTV